MNVFSCYSPLTVTSCVSDLLLKHSVGVERLPLLQLPEYKIFEVLIMPPNHFGILKSFPSFLVLHNTITPSCVCQSFPAEQSTLDFAVVWVGLWCTPTVGRKEEKENCGVSTQKEENGSGYSHFLFLVQSKERLSPHQQQLSLLKWILLYQQHLSFISTTSTQGN